MKVKILNRFPFSPSQVLLSTQYKMARSGFQTAFCIQHPTSVLSHGHIHAAHSAHRQPQSSSVTAAAGPGGAAPRHTYDHVLVGRVHSVNDRDLRGEGTERAQRTNARARPWSPSPSPAAQPGAAAGPGVPCAVPGIACAVPRAAWAATGGRTRLRWGPEPGRRRLPDPAPSCPGPPALGPAGPRSPPPHHGGGGPAVLLARPLPALSDVARRSAHNRPRCAPPACDDVPLVPGSGGGHCLH